MNKKDNTTKDDGTLRTFSSGATRDTNTDKPEFGGFLSPVVLRAFGQYMHRHRKQTDGNLRDSDNWKKGMPRRVYLESLLRHVMDVHGYITGDDYRQHTAETCMDALMAVIFNAQGLAREIIIGRSIGVADPDYCCVACCDCDGTDDSSKAPSDSSL